MKFLIPNYCPADSFVDNVSFTLRQMGHEVLTMPNLSNSRFSSPYRKLWMQVREKVDRNYQTDQEKWLSKTYQTFRPDVVLTLTQSLSEQLLFQLKKDNIKTVVWWGDTAGNMKQEGLLVDGWDLIYIKDEYAAYKLQTVGLNAFQMGEAMNPYWHKALKAQENNYLIFAGSFYNYRHFLTRKLIQDQVEVQFYGSGLPRWADPQLRLHHTGEFVVKERKSQVFGAGLAVLNSTAMSEFDSVNCRAFEIAGAAGLQIMEYRPSIEHYFEIGKEILVYRSYEELLAIIDRAIKSPKEMAKIRMAGHKRAHDQHTYEKRLTKIIDALHQL